MHIDSHKVYEYIFVNGQLHGLFSAVYLCKMKILTVITPILIFITCVYYSAAWDHIYGVLVPLWYGALKSIISISCNININISKNLICALMVVVGCLCDKCT